MNISCRTTVILIFNLLLLVVNGCFNSDIPQGMVQEDPQVIQQKKQSIPPKPAVTEPDKLEAAESDNISDWKQIRTEVSLGELTEHGSQPINNGKKYGFSICFPGSWTLVSGVLYDADNNKVAEIPPAILLKPGEESLFLRYKPAEDSGEELIMKEEIVINRYQGSRTITKISTECGSWYPHIYRVIDETFGFTIVLYAKEINKNDQALFDGIVNTFNLEQ